MTRRKAHGSLSLAALVLLVAAALGASGALALASPSLPSALRTAEPLTSVAVSSRDFDDARTVELSLETGAQRQLSSPMAGTLTATECHPGGSFTSGKPFAAVAGQTLVGLATSGPLWRDIHDKDTGDDVRGLQTELARLGYPLRVDGIAGAETLQAAAKMLGTGSGIDAIPYASFVWLPTQEVSASSCPAPLGGTVETGQALATLPVTLSSMRVTSLPDDLVSGPRTLSVGSVRIDIPSDGKVSDPAKLSVISSLPDYANALSSDGQPTLSGEFALSKPLDVLVVPPSALFGSKGTTACIAEHGTVIPVGIVGSELGETFVVPRSELTSSHVDVSPRALPCRS